MPNFSSSPSILGDPQRGFSRLICRMRFRVSRGVFVRPGPRLFHRQRALNPLRCQATTVSGLTMTQQLDHRFQTRQRNDQKIRSAFPILGRSTERRRTLSCWRRARFSIIKFSLERNNDHENQAMSLKSRLPIDPLSLFIEHGSTFRQTEGW